MTIPHKATVSEMPATAKQTLIVMIVLMLKKLRHSYNTLAETNIIDPALI